MTFSKYFTALKVLTCRGVVTNSIDWRYRFSKVPGRDLQTRTMVQRRTTMKWFIEWNQEAFPLIQVTRYRVIEDLNLWKHLLFWNQLKTLFYEIDACLFTKCNNLTEINTLDVLFNRWIVSLDETFNTIFLKHLILGLIWNLLFIISRKCWMSQCNNSKQMRKYFPRYYMHSVTLNILER